MTTPSLPIDYSRCFPISSLSPPNDVATMTAEDYVSTAKSIMKDCCEKSSRKGSLYGGGLGPHVYLRYQMSKMILPETSRHERIDLLPAAKAAAEYSYACATRSSRPSSFRVSLLEGKQIGALCLLAAIDRRLGISDTQYTVPRILWILETTVPHLPPDECEVLYGRAGSIQTILWLRQELQDASIGRELVVQLALSILLEGQKQGNNTNGALTWKWHDKVYLGAAHGIVGILQTLLSLDPLDWTAVQKTDPTALQKVQETIRSLVSSDYCFYSGNLKSSISSSHKACPPDKLVHWCHGAPGLVLLLIQAAKVFPGDKEIYLQNAGRVAESVLWPRGLLRKGVGLCHGISGNGMVLLRLAMIQEVADERIKWRNRAFQYLHFAMDNWDALSHVPDRPHSLFEGAGGLVCFLLQCAAFLKMEEEVARSTGNPSNDHNDLLLFPLYEFTQKNREQA